MKGVACRNSPRDAVEDVVVAVAVGLHQQLARLPLVGQIEQDRKLLSIPIPNIMRRELKVPLELARVGIRAPAPSRNRGCRPGGRRRRSPATGCPSDQYIRFSLGSKVPAIQVPAPPHCEGFVAPGFRAGLAFVGDRPETPQLFAGCGGEGSQEAAHARVAAADAGDDLVFDGDRRHGAVVALGGVGVLMVPDQRAGFAVDGHQVAIAGDEENLVAQDAGAAVLASHLDLFLAVEPDAAPAARVDGVHFVAVGDVHQAVVDDRHGGETPRSVDMIGPLGNQRADVVARDLGERAVALRGVVAGIAQPVLPGAGEQVFIAHLRGERQRGQGQRQRAPQQPAFRRRQRFEASCRHCPSAAALARRVPRVRGRE